MVSAIGLDNTKIEANVGGVLRAAHVYRASMVAISGNRYKKQSTDTTKAYRHIPLISGVADLFDVIPYDCVPIAVDLVDDATSLITFKHPKNAFYIFGAEDNTLGDQIISRCKEAVYIPTQFCMNLAATVNVVLYDRLSKSLT